VALSACKKQEPRAAQSADTSHASALDPTPVIRAAADSIVAAFGRQDSAGYFSRFAPEASFIFHTTARRLNGRAEYEAEWQSWKSAGFRVRSCRSSDQRVQVFGDVAIFTHSVRTEVTTREGDDTLVERETIIFQRQNDRWQAVHEHLSPQPAS
jgi:Ketosteroid isomerase homolog